MRIEKENKTQLGLDSDTICLLIQECINNPMSFRDSIWRSVMDDEKLSQSAGVLIANGLSLVEVEKFLEAVDEGIVTCIKSGLSISNHFWEMLSELGESVFEHEMSHVRKAVDLGFAPEDLFLKFVAFKTQDGSLGFEAGVKIPDPDSFPLKMAQIAAAPKNPSVLDKRYIHKIL